MKGIGDLMKQAQQVQEKIQKAQAELADMLVTGESGAGLVKIVLNGKHEAHRVELEKSLLSEDKEVIEDLIAAAINDAVHRVEAEQKSKMGNLASGFGVPTDFKLPF